METSDIESKRERAAKRINELKGFYIHLAVYVIVNIMISVIIIVSNMSSGDSFIEALLNFNTFSTSFFWGIGIFFHGARVFGLNPFFGKDWEERKIKKILEEDQNDINKYR